MHGLWDSGRIESKSEDFWLTDLTELDTPENRAAWMRASVEEWATESLLAAHDAYVVPGSDQRMKSGQKLGDEYLARQLPVVRRRLCQAGVRLAWVLNEALPAGPSQQNVGQDRLIPPP
jgi:S1/P1 Nuclease